MAYVAGKNGQITFGGNAIANLKSWSLNHSVGTVDVSTMSVGTSNTPYIPTQYATTYTLSGSADCFFDADSAQQLGAVNSLVAGTSVAITIFPETGESVAINPAMITGANFSSSVDGLVELSITFSANGNNSVTQLS